MLFMFIGRPYNEHKIQSIEWAKEGGEKKEERR